MMRLIGDSALPTTQPSQGACLKAMLWKNVQLKRRSWKTTLSELLSPPMLLALLVLGYSLSDHGLCPCSRSGNSRNEAGAYVDNKTSV